MNDYDPDEYEYQELLAERRQKRKDNKYWAQNDPEAPDFDDEEDDDEHNKTKTTKTHRVGGIQRQL